MKITLRVCFLLLLASFTTGCMHVGAVMVGDAIDQASETKDEAKTKVARLTGQYVLSARNAEVLRRVLAGQKVTVGKFETPSDPGKREIMCRIGEFVSPPRMMTYAEYVRSAFVADLGAADGYIENSAVRVTGALEEIDFSSFSGTWTAVLALTSSNGKSVRVSSTYNFFGAFGGAAACGNTKDALMPATEALINKLVNAKGFAELFQEKEL